MEQQFDADALAGVVTTLLPAVLRTLESLEHAQRHAHPERFPEIAQALSGLRPDMQSAVDALAEVRWPERLAGFGVQLGTVVREAHGALERGASLGSAPDAFVEWIRAMRGRARALEALYPLGAMFSPVSTYFIEPAVRGDEDRRAAIEAGMRSPPAEPPVGVLNASNDRAERGGFSLYVPEYVRGGDPPRPLVVALHGGSGHGADFLWTWVREARTRGFVLLAPTARGQTWSLSGPDLDGEALARMVEYVATTWPVDRARVLLTGMSDGATYATLVGLAEGSPFTALAPLCGVFHPGNLVNGNLARAAGRRVYLVHGALDWMFPVATAQAAWQQLLAAGADVTYREVPDLAHTYPRDENDGILGWFDPSLALPPAAAKGDG